MLRREFLVSAAAASLLRGANTAPLMIGGKEVAQFHYGPEWDKPFLYPLRAVSGRVISRGHPIEKREGEAVDHPWHRGLWWGHGDINGHDFWREQGRDRTSRIVVVGQPAGKGNSVSAEGSLVTPKKETIGAVLQTWSVTDRNKLRLIDATITIRAGENQPIRFGDTEDGGFAFRLSDVFREDRGAILRNSEGQTGAQAIWGKPARWTDYSAQVDGQQTGAAIFDHPANFRHPTGWHARNYSLNSANPFAAQDFAGKKVKEISHTLPPGGKLTFRYRVLIHEGPFDVAALEREYRAWANSM